MILYHATPARNVPAIEAEGLDPRADGLGAGTARVHLQEDPYAAAGFVEGMYREPVAVFAVDCRGLALEPGDDDLDGEWAFPGRIGPERLALSPHS